ncbi:phosphatase 2C-like domain-containing protein [Melanogaster broomeanus]|nr:phosphatase 2C-like domain-containing protein [Melanogaster broomeanus]
MVLSAGSGVYRQAQPSSSQASHYDIPGSICSSEDGPWPRPFTSLGATEAWKKLSHTSDHQSMLYGANGRWRADAVNFQPFPDARSQDRYAMQRLNIGGRMWTFTAVFDGHLGDATVEHAAYHMPIIVREFLEDMTQKHGGHIVPPPLIADMFSNSIRSFDEAIARDVLELYASILHDHKSGGNNFKKARLCMYGTTALVALVDPDHENLWLANLGDCQGVMISETANHSWNFEILTTVHNGENVREIERVKREHPGEPECVVDSRVLGAIAPFRYESYTICTLVVTALHHWEEFLVRNFTPPYISSTPEVTHYPLDPSQRSLPKYLVLCSDGFTDICGEDQRRVIERWLQHLDSSADCGGASNLALQLLWQGLGGDPVSVSRALTLDSKVPWLDDISIVVQSL